MRSSLITLAETSGDIKAQVLGPALSLLSELRSLDDKAGLLARAAVLLPDDECERLLVAELGREQEASRARRVVPTLAPCTPRSVVLRMLKHPSLYKPGPQRRLDALLAFRDSLQLGFSIDSDEQSASFVALARRLVAVGAGQTAVELALQRPATGQAWELAELAAVVSDNLAQMCLKQALPLLGTMSPVVVLHPSTAWHSPVSGTLTLGSSGAQDYIRSVVAPRLAALGRTSEAHRCVTEIQDPEWRLNALAGCYGSASSSEQWLNAVETAVSLPVRSTRLAGLSHLAGRMRRQPRDTLHPVGERLLRRVSDLARADGLPELCCVSPVLASQEGVADAIFGAIADVSRWWP